MFAKNLKPRERVIFGVFLFVLGVYVCVYGLIKPLQNKNVHVSGQIEAVQRDIQRAERTIRKATAIAVDDKYIDENFAQKQPDQQTLAEMMSTIEGQANALGLTIADLKPRTVESETYFKRFAVSLTIDSEFDQVIEFLHRLQSLPYLFELREVQFNRGPRKQTDRLKTRVVLGKIFVETEGAIQ